MPLPLSEAEFIEELERANRERFDDQEWTFNPPQEQAILHGEGPLHVTAGPGSGKTEVLICRALKLLLVDEVHPQSILLTTFTEKAAQNLEERIADRLARLGYENEIDINELRTGTLHSVCKDIMHDYRYEDYANVELLDGDAQQLFMYDNCSFVDVLRTAADPEDWAAVDGDEIDDAWREFGELRSGWGNNYPPNKWESTELAAKLFNRLSQYRVDLEQLRQHGSTPWQLCAEGLQRYRQTLNEHRRSDFARLLEQFLGFLDSKSGGRFLNGEPDRDRPPLEHVLVDEYQDTNPLQEELYFSLGERLAAPNITVVGDDDQALYRFRGGTVECLIEFPNRAANRFDTDVETVQLRTNYRSTEDIVCWCNRYIEQYPLLQSPGARAPGKEPMLVGRSETGDQTSVRGVLEENDEASAEAAANLVYRMYEEDYIEDWSQVAFLFKSTQESERWAGKYIDALEECGIPVYNPRNKSYLERPEIQFALGAIVSIIDPDLEGADLRRINLVGNTRSLVESWRDGYDSFVDEYDATDLDDFVTRKREEIRAADDGEQLGYTLLDLLYRILTLEPFQTWIEREVEPESGRRLGQLTNLFDSFASVSGAGYLSKSGSADAITSTVLGSFYWTFCGYLQANDFDEPENPHDQLPAGYVQVMTTHQAKGLEFPVVFVCDVDSEPWTSGTYWIENELAPYAAIEPVGDDEDRAERDEVRRFYVSYSRAEEDLFLLGPEHSTTELSLGYDSTGNPVEEDWFNGDRRIQSPDDFLESSDEGVGGLDETDLKRRYSITGDVLAFRRCRRQYGYYNELNFTPNHVTQLFFGRVVHETLDVAHRHYAGEIEGVDGGEIPDDDDIEQYFTEIAEALKARNIYPMSEEAEDTALEYIQRFNEREGARMYPRVVDTEYRLQSNRDDFILEGVVDVLAGEQDGAEIWDYKAGQRPDGNSELEDYQAQLFTYAELYRYRNGEYPERGVIYFLGASDRDEAMFEVNFNPEGVQGSIDEFERTVSDIESARESGDWFDIDLSERPSEGTCAECDVRWNCPARPEFHGEQ